MIRSFRKNLVRLASAAATAALAASAVLAQTPNYGTAQLTYVQIPGAEFVPLVSSTPYTLTATTSGRALRVGPTGGAYFSAPVHIPSGALIKYLELDFCDVVGGSGGHEQAALIESDKTGTVLQATTFLMSTVSTCGSVSQDLTPLGLAMNNQSNHYWLLAFLDAQGSNNNGLAGMVVGYQLQVSPAPGSATFNDVPTTHQFFQFIEAFAAAGITGGCGNNNYCPDNPVTRGQMAVFLAKALGLQFP